MNLSCLERDMGLVSEELSRDMVFNDLNEVVKCLINEEVMARLYEKTKVAPATACPTNPICHSY